MTKREQSLLLFQNNLSVYRCPLCHGPFQLTASGSLVCGQGHCYDISGKGYVNFVPNQKATHYGRDLFESRRRVFQAGFYEPVLAALTSIIEDQGPERKPLLLLDAGCGEGYYVSGLSQRLLYLSAFGVDLEKEAVRMACGVCKGVSLGTADLARLPFADHSMDLILNLLTPASYGEFKRVLRPNGLLIKLIPGERYLCEIRSLLREKLRRPSGSEGAAASYLETKLRQAEKRRIFYTRPLTEEEAADFLSMTPLTFGVDTKRLPAGELTAITIDVQIFVGRLY